MSDQMARNFRASEFACHDGTPWPADEQEALKRVANTCQIIRDAWGGAVTVVSAYRHPGYKSQHRKPRSQHAARGPLKRSPPCAVDLAPDDCTEGRSLAFYLTIRGLMDEGQIPKGGLGRYPGSFTHVDDRCFYGYRAAKWGPKA